MKVGLSISNEAMGAFIDAVYAIAVTILALELPRTLDSDTELAVVGEMLVNYAISFLILFALWVQHRRINAHIESYSPAGLWLNAGILMLVCLIPRATSFVFESGGSVEFDDLEQAVENFRWTLAAIIDIGFIAIVLASDIGLVVLMHCMPKAVLGSEAADIYRSKVTISTLLVLVLAASLFLPLQNRFFLLVIPLCLMFEHRIAAAVSRLHRRNPAS